MIARRCSCACSCVCTAWHYRHLQRMAGFPHHFARDSGSACRYISGVMRRAGIAIVVQRQARNLAIWGKRVHVCASDSKHFGAWIRTQPTQPASVHEVAGARRDDLLACRAQPAASIRSLPPSVVGGRR